MKPARLLPGDTRWHARAACRDAPDGLFDPPEGSHDVWGIWAGQWWQDGRRMV